MAANDEGRYFAYAAWPIPLGILGGILWAWSNFSYRPVYETEFNLIAIVTGLWLAAAYIGLAAVRIRGERNWQARLAIVACLAAIGWAFFALGAIPFANGVLGSRTDDKHYAKILEAHRSGLRSAQAAGAVLQVAALSRGRMIRRPGRNAERFELVVASWIPGRTTEILDVRPGELESAVAGQVTHMEIVTRQGLFHVPWVVSAKTADKYVEPVAPDLPLAETATAVDGPLEWNSSNMVWFTNSADAWKESQASKRMMFVLFHNADRAAHDSLVAMLSTAEAAVVLERCVLVRLDVSEPAGQKAAAGYGVTQTPTLMVFDLAGKPKGQVLVDLTSPPTWDKVYGQLRAAASK